jgi:hypothetical protein
MFGEIFLCLAEANLKYFNFKRIIFGIRRKRAGEKIAL